MDGDQIWKVANDAFRSQYAQFHGAVEQMARQMRPVLSASTC